MKLKAKSLLVLVFAFVVCGINAQTATNQETVTAKLGYHPEFPAPKSYTVVKNTTGQQLPDSVLLKINFFRRANENFQWKVNENIELLIFPINAPMERN